MKTESHRRQERQAPELSVLIRGAMYSRAEKPWFVPSGQSLHGAMEATPDGLLVKCHECGFLFASVGVHLQHCSAGRITASEYKQRHGLNMRTTLRSPVARKAAGKAMRKRFKSRAALKAHTDWMRKRVKNPGRKTWVGTKYNYELRNQADTCRAQLAARARQIAAEIGECPSSSTLAARGLSTHTLRRAGYKSYADLREVAGLTGFRKKTGTVRYDAALLIELLRDAYAKLLRVPQRRDCYPPLLPAHSTFVRVFGSWATALEVAGLGLILRQSEAS